MHLIHDQNNSRQQVWVAVEDFGKGKVWEFFVHGARGTGDTVCCPSIGMAFEKIGADPRAILAQCPSLANDGPAE